MLCNDSEIASATETSVVDSAINCVRNNCRLLFKGVVYSPLFLKVAAKPVLFQQAKRTPIFYIVDSGS